MLVFIWMNMMCVGYALLYCVYIAFYNLHVIFTGRGGFSVVGHGEEVIVVMRFFKFLGMVGFAGLVTALLFLLPVPGSDVLGSVDWRAALMVCLFLIILTCGLCCFTIQLPDKE